jgi:F0F1-type ATP synthase membrane subunit b/b'
MKLAREEGNNMIKVQESLEPVVSETENIIQEYRDKIRQALEIESGKLKERAERDSSQILTRAKDEAAKVVSQARQDAKAESERLLATANEEAEQITRESREEASEARQESARVLSEAREKASQIGAEVIERSTKQAQSEFAKAASEARSKVSRLLTQVSASVEKIIDETETNLNAELERLAADIVEAETKLKPLSETHDKKAEVNSRRASAEAVMPTAPVGEKTEPAAPSAGDKRNAPAKSGDESKLFKGALKLEVIPSFDQEQTGGVPEWLAKVRGLKVTSTGGYAGMNRWITTYTIDLEQPMPLLKILKSMPQVKYAAESKGNIIITLK